MPVTSRSLYSLSRDGDSGTKTSNDNAAWDAFSFYSLSRDGDSGTSTSESPSTKAPGFYSLSRDGDSGTYLRVRRHVHLAFLFAVPRWGQRNFSAKGSPSPMRRFYSLSRDGDSGTDCATHKVTQARTVTVSIRCREMGTAEPEPDYHHGLGDTQFLFAVARWGQRNPKTNPAGNVTWLFLFAVARWGQRNTLASYVDTGEVTFLFAVARWGQRNFGVPYGRLTGYTSFYSLSRDGDSGTSSSTPRPARSQCFYSLSRDGDSGTAGRAVMIPGATRFYSLSRDGDSGTPGSSPRKTPTLPAFLFAVARWGQRKGAVGYGGYLYARRFLFAVARWGQRNYSRLLPGFDDAAGFLFAVARWGQRNTFIFGLLLGEMFLFAVARWGQRNDLRRSRRAATRGGFLFAVARWGQRNPAGTTDRHVGTRFYSLSRDGDSGTRRKRPTRPQGRVPLSVSIRCREMGTAEPPSDTPTSLRRLVSIRCREMGTAERRRRWPDIPRWAWPVRAPGSRSPVRMTSSVVRPCSWSPTTRSTPRRVGRRPKLASTGAGQVGRDPTTGYAFPANNPPFTTASRTMSPSSMRRNCW